MPRTFIKGSDIAADTISTVNMLDAAITTAKIADLNVTAGKLAADSVTTAKILDLNVTTAKIADNAITSAKLADASQAERVHQFTLPVAWRPAGAGSFAKTFGHSSGRNLCRWPVHIAAQRMPRCMRRCACVVGQRSHHVQLHEQR